MNATRLWALVLLFPSALAFAQDTPKTPLDMVIVAIQDSDIVALKAALATKPKPDLNSSENTIFGGETPLTIAVSSGFIPGLEPLIKAGADVNAANKIGRTPLLECIINVREAFSGMGGDNDGDPMSKQNRMKNSKLAAKLLIKNGANVNMADPETGETPLFVAALSGHAEMVQILLDAKAKASVKNTDGKTVIQRLQDRAEEIPRYADKYTDEIIKLLRKAPK